MEGAITHDSESRTDPQRGIQVARERGYVRPTVDDSMALAVRGGRHPVLEATLTDATFVPNDVMLGGDAARIVILTGPNMAGKSTRRFSLLSTGSSLPFSP